jgi:hypothetical protein
MNQSKTDSGIVNESQLPRLGIIDPTATHHALASEPGIHDRCRKHGFRVNKKARREPGFLPI